MLGLRSGTTVWPPGQAPLPPAPWSGRGRPPTRLRRSPEHQPVSVQGTGPRPAQQGLAHRDLARGRPGLTSRFATRRVRPAHRDTLRSEPWPEEWLLIEWPEGTEEPSKYWLSNLPPRTTLKDLVHTAKARWLIERDYQELKQETGLGHYEGRGWRGFHHHASLCIAAYGFLVAAPAFFPLSAALPTSGRHLRYPEISSRAAPPIRPERHVPHSIASIRRRLTVALVERLAPVPLLPTEQEIWPEWKNDTVSLGRLLEIILVSRPAKLHGITRQVVNSTKRTFLASPSKAHTSPAKVQTRAVGRAAASPSKLRRPAARTRVMVPRWLLIRIGWPVQRRMV